MQADYVVTRKKRAWLTLWSQCPAYCVYFAIQVGFPTLVPTLLTHIACLALVASVHAVSYIVGLLLIKRGERGENLLEDERDRAIDGRATRAAYFVLLTGMIVVSVFMPLDHVGTRDDWQIVNSALFFIVLAETVRQALIVLGYRRPRLAH